MPPLPEDTSVPGGSQDFTKPAGAEWPGHHDRATCCGSSRSSSCHPSQHPNPGCPRPAGGPGLAGGAVGAQPYPLESHPQHTLSRPGRASSSHSKASSFSSSASEQQLPHTERLPTPHTLNTPKHPEPPKHPKHLHTP